MKFNYRVIVAAPGRDLVRLGRLGEIHDVIIIYIHQRNLQFSQTDHLTWSIQLLSILVVRYNFI